MRLLLPLALGITLARLPAAPAKPAFTSSEIEGQGSELICCDLNGDRLKDAVLMDRVTAKKNLAAFPLHRSPGF